MQYPTGRSVQAFAVMIDLITQASHYFDATTARKSATGRSARLIFAVAK